MQPQFDLDYKNAKISLVGILGTVIGCLSIFYPMLCNKGGSIFHEISYDPRKLADEIVTERIKFFQEKYARMLAPEKNDAEQRTSRPNTFGIRSKWSVGAGRATGSKEDTKTLNAYLDTLKIYEAKRSLIEANKEVTSEAIKNILLGRTESGKTILRIFREHNDQIAALIGSDFAPGALERYETCLKHTCDFIKWKYQADDFEIKQPTSSRTRIKDHV